MNNLKLLIDVRETKIIEEIKKNSIDITYKIKRLKLGDFIFYNLLENGRTNVRVLIERKTIPDLVASKLDGRKDEQLSRINKFSCEKKCYLIEGSIDRRKKYKLPHSSIETMIVNLTFRDSIHVIRTKNIKDTVRNLAKIYKCLQKSPVIKTTEISDIKSLENKTNIADSKTLIECCFRLIPGIGKKTTNRIANCVGNQQLFEPNTIAYILDNCKLNKTQKEKIRNFML